MFSPLVRCDGSAEFGDQMSGRSMSKIWVWARGAKAGKITALGTINQEPSLLAETNALIPPSSMLPHLAISDITLESVDQRLRLQHPL